MPCSAETKKSDELSKIETTLFNLDYEGQDNCIRLNRIEKSVYGNPIKDSTENRLKKLSKDLSADVIGEEVNDKEDNSDDGISLVNLVDKKDISAIDSLEQKVFKYEFKTVNINNRLIALEYQTFKKCYAEDDLKSRIDRLQGAVFYNKYPVNETKTEETPKLEQKIVMVNHSEEEKKNLGSTIKISTLEKAIFNTTYAYKTTPERLTKLETKIFQSTFPYDDTETRLNRIKSASVAQKSIKKYKGNRTSNHVATTIEIGAIILMLLPFLL